MIQSIVCQVTSNQNENMQIDAFFTRFLPPGSVAKYHMYCENGASIEVSMTKNSIVVERIRSTNRGHGHASHALAKICHLADECNVTLELIAEPFGWEALTKRALISWYSRNGFYLTEKNRMRRNPKLIQSARVA